MIFGDSMFHVKSAFNMWIKCLYLTVFKIKYIVHPSNTDLKLIHSLQMEFSVFHFAKTSFGQRSVSSRITFARGIYWLRIYFDRTFRNV